MRDSSNYSQIRLADIGAPFLHPYSQLKIEKASFRAKILLSNHVLFNHSNFQPASVSLPKGLLKGTPSRTSQAVSFTNKFQGEKEKKILD